MSDLLQGFLSWVYELVYKQKLFTKCNKLKLKIKHVPHWNITNNIPKKKNNKWVALSLKQKLKRKKNNETENDTR